VGKAKELRARQRIWRLSVLVNVSAMVAASGGGAVWQAGGSSSGIGFSA